jgi:hypothetical protein
MKAGPLKSASCARPPGRHHGHLQGGAELRSKVPPLDRHDSASISGMQAGGGVSVGGGDGASATAILQSFNSSRPSSSHNQIQHTIRLCVSNLRWVNCGFTASRVMSDFYQLRE